MLLYNQQLEELIRYKNQTNNPMVSLYLNMPPGVDAITRLNSMIHSARNNLKTTMEKDRFEAVDRLLTEIENYARHNLKRVEKTRLVVIFADTAGFWQEYRLPVSLPGHIAVDSDPYIRPLSALLDQFDRYLVLVADSRHARLFSLYLGDFEAHPDIFMEDEAVPDRVRANESMARASGGQSAKGVYGGLGDKRIEGHIKDHIHKHLKNTTDKTFNFFKEKNHTQLIIGTPEDKNRSWLKDHLHSYLKERLAGEFNANPSLPDSELKELALETAKQYERERETRLIDTVFEKNSPGNLGVLGIDPIIRALRKGQVHTLIIENGYQTKGFICRDDDTLSLSGGDCPLCGHPMEEVDDLLDEMVAEALLQNSEIKHIFTNHPEFEQYHAGALLRYIIQ